MKGDPLVRVVNELRVPLHFLLTWWWFLWAYLKLGQSERYQNPQHNWHPNICPHNVIDSDIGKDPNPSNHYRHRSHDARPIHLVPPLKDFLAAGMPQAAILVGNTVQKRLTLLLALRQLHAGSNRVPRVVDYAFIRGRAPMEPAVDGPLPHGMKGLPVPSSFWAFSPF